MSPEQSRTPAQAASGWAEASHLAFAFWAGEELGDIASTQYVRSLDHGRVRSRPDHAVARARPDARYPAQMPSPDPHRAVILAVGTELTTGQTRDSNGGDIGAELSALGVQVIRIMQLPDDLDAVADAFRRGMDDADLVVSTGGLGPTPDDLTREAIARAVGARVHVDPELERWLVELFERRGMRMPDANRKQAWLIDGAEALPNRGGTAPGWWMERDGRIVVALPGPPREALPMWRSDVLPRLRSHGITAQIAVRTLRLTGIGESHVAEALGEPMLRAANPVVATYARPDAVDVRITARPGLASDRGAVLSAEEILADAQRRVEVALGRHVFAYDDETWPDVLGRALGDRTVATWERGTSGALAALLAHAPWFTFGEIHRDGGEPATGRGDVQGLVSAAVDVRTRAGTRVGLALEARSRPADTGVVIGVDVDGRRTGETSVAFLAGAQGRRRAALAACALLWRALRDPGDARD